MKIALMAQPSLSLSILKSYLKDSVWRLLADVVDDEEGHARLPLRSGHPARTADLLLLPAQQRGRRAPLGQSAS